MADIPQSGETIALAPDVGTRVTPVARRLTLPPVKGLTLRTLFYIVAAIVVILEFFPTIWALLTSLMTPQETTSIPATLWPAHPTLGSYVSAIQGDIGHYYLNSIIASLVSTAITTALATSAAYAFARLRFRFKTAILIFVLALSLFPPLAQLIPVYIVLQKLHLIGTLGALILPYSVFGLPLAVLILMAFFQDAPRDLEEAAMVDGLTRFRAFLRVILPITLPGVFTAAVMVFVQDWNEYLFALNYTNTNTYTLPVGIVTISQTEFTTNFGVLSAATILSVVPLVVIILLLQRRIVSGLTAGAVKG
jgi:multiple sugar transport system permease protein